MPLLFLSLFLSQVDSLRPRLFLSLFQVNCLLPLLFLSLFQVDSLLPLLFRDFLSSSVLVLATLLVILIQTPLFAVVLVPLALFYHIVQVCASRANSRFRRLGLYAQVCQSACVARY